MAFEKAIQSLGVIEEKLRRAFGLAGPIGARLVPELKPVIISGDLREPGHAYSQGRCWSLGVKQLAFGANAYWSAIFDADVLIEGMIITANPQDSFDVYTTVPGQIPAQVISTANGSWRDRRTVSTDVPPIRSAAAAGGLAGGGTVEANGNRIAAGRLNGIIPISMMLPNGASLNLHSVAGAGDTGFTIWGRIWP